MYIDFELTTITETQLKNIIVGSADSIARGDCNEHRFMTEHMGEYYTVIVRKPSEGDKKYFDANKPAPQLSVVK